MILFVRSHHTLLLLMICQKWFSTLPSIKTHSRKHTMRAKANNVTKTAKKTDSNVSLFPSKKMFYSISLLSVPFRRSIKNWMQKLRFSVRAHTVDEKYVFACALMAERRSRFVPLFFPLTRSGECRMHFYEKNNLQFTDDWVRSWSIYILHFSIQNEFCPCVIFHLNIFLFFLFFSHSREHWNFAGWFVFDDDFVRRRK